MNTNLEERLTKRSEERLADLNHNKTPLSPTRRERSKAIIEEQPSTYENSPKVESISASRVSQCSYKKKQQKWLNHNAEAESLFSPRRSL